MFQFPGYVLPTLRRNTPIYIGVGYPIRKSSDQRLLPASRSLSQVATSFIVSLCQGIHLVPFVTWLQIFYLPLFFISQYAIVKELLLN
jgi:hypothetical protein